MKPYKTIRGKKVKNNKSIILFNPDEFPVGDYTFELILTDKSGKKVKVFEGDLHKEK